MNKAKKLWKKLKNKDENIRLMKWMIHVVKPYFRFVIYVFLISLVSMGISYASTIIGKYVVDDATTGVIDFRNMAFMCGTTIVSILISIFSNIISSYINEKFSFSIRQKLFNDIQRSVWIKISKYHSGDLVTRLTSDIGGLADGMISILPSTILIFFQLLISFGILLYYDWQIAVFALFLGPIGAAFMLFFRKKYKEYHNSFIKEQGGLWVGATGERAKLFTKLDGTPIFDSTIRKWVKKYMSWAGVPYITVHGLRHTYASILISNGNDARAVAAQLGHSTPVLVYNTYANPQECSKRKTAETLDNLFRDENA